MRLAFRHAVAFSIALPIVVTSFAACSLGQGNGSVTGDINVPDCWAGQFNLSPDFFAAVPYRDSLQLRIQNGGDYQTFSDGLSILIDNTKIIRPQSLPDGGTTAGELNVDIPVSLPPGVTAPGVPIIATSNPARVHVALYLQRTCRTQDVALYALDSVTLNAANGCDPGNGGEPIFTCPGQSADGTPPPTSSSDGGTGDAGTTAPVNGSIGHSTINFTSLFDNDVDEARADLRYNAGTFDLYLADPREGCPGGIGPPPPCRGHLTGFFKFYFERGRPAQPFP